MKEVRNTGGTRDIVITPEDRARMERPNEHTKAFVADYEKWQEERRRYKRERKKLVLIGGAIGFVIVLLAVLLYVLFH